MEKPLRPEHDFRYKPELHLVYRGLQITVSEGFMTKHEADLMLQRWEDEDSTTIPESATEPTPDPRSSNLTY